MSLSKQQQTTLQALVAVLVALVVLLQWRIDPLRMQKAIEPPNASKVRVGLKGATLPFEYTLGAVAGFRQVIAGLLWVRSDAFFHEGNYDAILPLIRLITWLDPNWLDPYATGAWHLTYNFTDTDQRSDRRYLPAGVALLNEGIANNPDLYDMYKEKGWLYYDKIKNYDESAKAYADGMQHNPDINQVGHGLAHALERSGRVDEAAKQWEENIRLHKATLDDPKASADAKVRAKQGFESSTKQLEMLKVREKCRPNDTQPPVDADFQFQVVRTKPKVIEVSGSWNLEGAKSFDVEKAKTVGRGIAVGGPVDGARVDVRLQDQGFVMPPPAEFTFDLDSSVTIMQDSISTKGGKKAVKGGLFMKQKTQYGTVDPMADKVGVYGFADPEASQIGVPLDKALAGAAPLSPFGQLQLVTIAYPLPYTSLKPLHDASEVPALMQKLRSDPAKVADLVKKGFFVATKDVETPGLFKREIDMSKDPKMYGFAKEKYDLILSFNPRNSPDFVKDRLGWNGEGLYDKKYLYLDSTTKPGIKMLRVVIPLTREEITGEGRKVLAASK
jgi:tetratricopeptide (TPR) repeat protein